MIDKQLKKSLETFMAFHYTTANRPEILLNVKPITTSSNNTSPKNQKQEEATKTTKPTFPTTTPPCTNAKPVNPNNTSLSAKPSIFKQLKDFLRKNFPPHSSRPSFSSQLINLIAEKGLSEPAVYKAANIDRKLFSKIRKPQYHPSKNTALALVIALKLTTSQAYNLLHLAGYTLSNNSKTDIIIMFCLENEVYDIILVNELLQEYTGKTL